MPTLSAEQLTGRSETHLHEDGGLRLQSDALKAFMELRQRAAGAGFDLRGASSFRSFGRQRQIWNEKFTGQRNVLDDSGKLVDLSGLNEYQQLAVILRFSALPGASRHHWGTDIDIYDAVALPDTRQLQLVAAEVDEGGVFAPLHRWLDEQIDAGDSCGFFRPYAVDRGGVAVERWHLSFAPVARQCQRAMSKELLLDVLSLEEVNGYGVLRKHIDKLYQRYVEIPESCYPG